MTVLPQMTAFAREKAIHLPTYSHIVDIGYLPNGNIKFVDVNPGLTVSDMAFFDNKEFI